MTEKRPIGVSILALILMFPSPFLMVGGIWLVVLSTIKTLREDSPVIWLLMSVVVPILGAVSAKAGIDLWRLKRDSLAPTVFLMCMTAVFTGIQVCFLASCTALTSLISSRYFRGWAAVCAFSVWAVVYLCVPRIRRRFDSGIKENET